MVKYKPKNFKCDNCGQEQYTNASCYRCGGKTFEDLIDRDQELRQLLHFTIDQMSLEQMQLVQKYLNSNAEVDAICLKNA